MKASQKDGPASSESRTSGGASASQDVISEEVITAGDGGNPDYVPNDASDSEISDAEFVVEAKAVKRDTEDGAENSEDKAKRRRVAKIANRKFIYNVASTARNRWCEGQAIGKLERMINDLELKHEAVEEAVQRPQQKHSDQEFEQVDKMLKSYNNIDMSYAMRARSPEADRSPSRTLSHTKVIVKSEGL